jgi:ubiquinone/menaquinone biosynthesis C-methylase UbiE
MVNNYLTETFDFNDARLVSALDEFSLWSAPFGLKLLECIGMKKGINALDIGPGTGFPMLELAQRLGHTSNIFGIDPWDAAIVRINQKINFYRLTNVQIQHAVAEEIPFPDHFFDLIVSNNGLNNVADLDKSLSECHRTTRPGAQMVITMNLPDSFIEFYNVLRKTLVESGLENDLKNVDDHIFHKRKPLDFLREKLQSHGFTIRQEKTDSFTYRFADGTALLNYSFFKICFLDGWKSCVDAGQLVSVFEKLEHNLNSLASQNHGIELTVPFVCFNLKREG